ncbi:MAG: HDOD domain-containing protein [Candidatus Cloacimonadota bacterium]|nr:HDOD domain-containing protein [Candidatus Cloacimonadota bacterium]
MGKEDFFKQLENISDLPTLPIVASKLMTLLASPNSSLKQISKIMTSDPAITAKVLKIANSAYYTTSNKVNSVRMALVILGENQITSIVYSLSLYRTFSDDIDSDFQNRFFTHALSTAHISKMLAKKLNLRLRDSVFTAGLIHEIGLIILNQYYNNEFRRVELLIKKKQFESHLAFKQILQIDQSEIGAWLAKRWKLPDQLVSSIVNHKCSMLQSNNKDQLAALVHIASMVATLIGFKLIDKYTLEDYIDNVCWDYLVKDPDNFDKQGLYEEILEKKDTIKDLVDLVKKS